MKPEELRGRELAAWLLGFNAGQPISTTPLEFAAAEIERLCAGKRWEDADSIPLPLPPDQAQAARDAAALDALCETMDKDHHRESAWPCPQYSAWKAIIERTGRKIGS